MAVRSRLAAIICATSIAAAASSTSAKADTLRAAPDRASVAVSEAVEIAEREVPSGWLFDAQTDTATDQATYTIGLVKEGLHSVQIGVRDGRVLATTQKPVEPKDWKTLAGGEGARVGLLAAVAIAKQAFPDAELVSARLKVRRGVPRWAVTLDEDGLGVVDIDPEDGKLLRIALQLGPEGNRRWARIEVAAALKGR